MNQQEKNRRTTMIALIAVMVVLALWCTCGARALAQCSDSPAHWPCPHQPAFPIVGVCPDEPVSPTEAQSDTATTLNTSGPSADGGQACAGQGLGGDALSRNPFSSNWLEAGYKLDSRDGDSNRIFDLEGHSRVAEHVDVHGQLELFSGVRDDLARFHLRAAAFGRVVPLGGVVARYEDFSGSGNEHAFFGAYINALTGGEEPFCRLELLPVSTSEGGAMGRAQFDVALHERWAISGFMEVSWFGEDGTYTAAEPELRYLIDDGIWATVEYRHDDRWGTDDESIALGLKAAL